MLNIIFAWSEISPMITFNDIKLKIIILHGNIGTQIDSRYYKS